MKYLIYLLMAVFLGSATVSLAVVDPVPADISEQDWMVNVLIKGERSKNYSLLCKGSLIHEYWVLSSSDCLTDPLGTIDDFVGSDSSEFAVALGNLGGLYPVEERLTSPDGSAMLLRLSRPTKNKPLRLLYRSPSQLKGVQARLFSNEYSTSLRDKFYNPEGEIDVSCSIDGIEFFNDGRMCYVTTVPEYSIFPVMAKGRIIDPFSPEAPTSPLNSSISPDTSGDRLYMDFSSNNSYPCYEDIGAPIIATVSGELAQVGLLVGAGMTTGVPMCNGSFVNNMISLRGLQDFIEQSIAKGVFAQSCPSVAALKFEQLGGTRVRLFWDEIDRATGYRLLATDALGYEPIQVFDLGADREITVELKLGTTYTLSLQGVNLECNGAMSSPLTLTFGN